MRPGPGALLGERYRLTDLIAVGGMGEVWRATDEVLGRDVAVKVLKEEYSGDPGFRERFRGEARHSAALSHPNIAGVYDYGEAAGSAYLVMELVPGDPLSDVLAQQGALPAREAMALVAQAASGLAAAHAAGVVHRDVKPGNLLVTPDRRVKITDFGIARVADAVPLTATGQVMGTAQYLAPEQAMGRRASPASDLYALGVVAYEALTGSRPFDGDSQVAVAMAHVNAAPAPLPPSLPRGARALVESAMAKDPAARPADAETFARAASAVARGDDDGAIRLLAGAAPTAGLPGTASAREAPEAPTQRLPAGSDDTTRALPVAAPGRQVPSPPLVTPPPGGAQRGRRALTGPLLALLALVAFLLLGAWLSDDLFGEATPAAEPTVAPSATTTAPQETEEPTQEDSDPPPDEPEILVQAQAYRGLDAAEARRRLESLGLVVTEVPEQTEAVPPGSVLSVSEGTFRPGDAVTLVVAAAPTPGPTPAPSEDADGSDEGQGGDSKSNDKENPGRGDDDGKGGKDDAGPEGG